MMSNRYRKLRSALGVSAIGALALGLSLQGAPASEDTTGTTERAKQVRGDAGAAATVRSGKAVEVAPVRKSVLPTLELEAPTKFRPGAMQAKNVRVPVDMRVKSWTGYAPTPMPAGRGTAAEGDPCSCDSECANLDSDGGCSLGQCIRAADDLGFDNDDGTCAIIVQDPDTRCETDGNPCTIGRCLANGSCEDGPSANSPCSKACAGDGDDVGQNCWLDTDCKDEGTECDDKPRVTCVVDDNGTAGDTSDDRANCQVDGADDQFGRCCDAAGDGAYTTQADCASGSTWLELTDPDDEMHIPVRCPGYSSGIVAGNTSNDANVIRPIEPPAMQCSKHIPEDNFGAVCEQDEDCVHRCAGDDVTVCGTASDCVDAGTTGPCLADTCISALDADVDDPAEGGRCPGPWAIGDDYKLDLPPGKALRLQEIRFRGGVERALEVAYLDFYDNASWRCVGGVDHGNSCTAWGDLECDSGKCRPVRVLSTRIRFAQGGIYTYTLERDCDPNCDQDQWCVGGDFVQCECLPRNEGCIADPPYIIPRDGWMVMRAGRYVTTSRGPDDLNGSWVPVDVVAGRTGPPVEAGTNDLSAMWVDDGPKGASDDAPLANGSRVLAFELVGRAVNAPIGSCCDPDTGDCTDTLEWDCRFCSGQGAEGQARKVCIRGGGNWSGVDRDCPDRADECLTADWAGPRLKSDYDEPTCHGGNDAGTSCETGNDCATGLCYGGERCGAPDNPCAGGACCAGDGTCTSSETLSVSDCPGKHCRKLPNQTCTDGSGCVIGETDFGPCQPYFLGFGSDCEMNCCPQPVDYFAECCEDKYRCTGGLLLECDPLDVDACDGEDEGTCELACAGPVVLDIPVPSLIPPGQATVIDYSTDSRDSAFNTADSCAGTYNDGWYMRFHVSECANVTWTFCCTDPQLQFVSTALRDGCPCSGPGEYVLHNDGRSGFGDACGNDHCCQDGNYSVEWTVRPGTYHYTQIAGSYCEQTYNGCNAPVDCPPGERCISWKMPFQGHIIVSPCYPAACCNDSHECETAADCPPNPHGGSAVCTDGVCEDHCSWLPKFECEDAGGDWLGDLTNPIGDCFDTPCSEGACCTADGSCEDQNGDGMTPEACAALEGGDYHGGIRCANRPCTVCEFEDQLHCQLDTGIYIFPSDRFVGSRAADDFRPLDSPIARVCFNFGFSTENSTVDCSESPPPFDFHIRFYEDAFGIPGQELIDSPGPVEVDRAEPNPGYVTWNFSAPLDPPVDVVPGECYWIEITGVGDGFCTTMWTHSVDGNNYRMRDDGDNYGIEDMRFGDLVFCLNTGIGTATEPGVDGGCGDFAVACCNRDRTCEQLSHAACTAQGGYGMPYADCNTPDICPFPPNDFCDTDGNGTPDGAYVICEGNQEHPEHGAWTYFTGGVPEDRLGQCQRWPGEAGFGEICNPVAQDCGDPPNDPPGANVCFPHFFEAYECYAETDNRLAATDGPLGADDCGDTSMQADVWYKVTAPCTGQGVITMCSAPAEYDSMMGLFGDHSTEPRCPGPGDDNEDLIVCNDDYCSGYGTGSGLHWDAAAGAVYIVRLAGWSRDGNLLDAGQGLSELHVGFLCNEVTPWEPPGLPTNPEHQKRKHRYLSIDPTTNLPNVAAIKVEIAEMNRCQNDLRRSCIDDADCPTVCAADKDIHSCGTGGPCPDGVCIPSGPCGPHPNVGMSWWVQEPQTRGAGCPNGMCDEEDYYARVDAAIYGSEWTDECNGPDWTGGCTTLHIGDCEIVPGVKYNVYACDAVSGDPCSDPLVVETTRKSELMPHYGDVAGPVTPELIYTGPDDYTSVIDIGAYLLTLKNWGTTSLPQAHPTWLDLHGPGAGIPPQYIIMVTDLTMILRAFVDIWPYENTIGGFAPGDCP